MLRWLYIQLLRAHPAEFRHRFGDEMLEAFDSSRGFNRHLRLQLDVLVSLWRQWVLRPEYRQPLRPAAASGPVHDLVTFQQIEPYKPRGIALAEGGLMALLLLLGIVNAINHGGGKTPTFLIGMRRPGNGLIKVDRAAFEGTPSTSVARLDPDDPLRPFARSYFGIVRVLSALDADHDLTISAEEIAKASAALLLLDRNHDGKLSAEECGFLSGGGRRDFMRQNPVLAALDADHNGEISAAEIANSPAALKSLDINNDGKLTPYELLPNPALSQAAALMTRFDTDDSGVIAIQAVSSSDADATSIQSLLAAADRNHDGLITRGELLVELALRYQPPTVR